MAINIVTAQTPARDALNMLDRAPAKTASPSFADSFQQAYEHIGEAPERAAPAPRPPARKEASARDDDRARGTDAGHRSTQKHERPAPAKDSVRSKQDTPDGDTAPAAEEAATTADSGTAKEPPSAKTESSAADASTTPAAPPAEAPAQAAVTETSQQALVQDSTALLGMSASTATALPSTSGTDAEAQAEAIAAPVTGTATPATNANAAPSSAATPETAQQAKQTTPDQQAPIQLAQTVSQPAAAQTAAPPTDLQASELARLLGDGDQASIQTKAAATVDAPIVPPRAPLISTGGLFIQAQDSQSSMGNGGQQHPGQQGQTEQNSAALANGQSQPEAAAAMTAAADQKFVLPQTAQPANAAPQQAALPLIDASGMTGGLTQHMVPSGAMAFASQTSAPASAARPQVPPHALANQIGVHIIKAAANGAEAINIQLHPLELGRINVQLNMAKDGRLAATITADSRETLALLQQDSQSLQRALQDAGFQTDSGSMNFNLREQGRQFGESRNGDRNGNRQSGAPTGDGLAASSAAAPQYQTSTTADGGLDIRI